MGFKTITVNEESKCPDCGGKGGLRYFEKINLACIVGWGETSPKPQFSKTEDYILYENMPMTAKCIDCGKRVNFKVNVPTCYECGKPRGKEENGDFVCPCPECGNEDPF